MKNITQESKQSYKLPKCHVCSREFYTIWEARRHTDRCRPVEGHFIKIKRNGKYNCDFYKKAFEKMLEFKCHVFSYHNDIETAGKYNRRVEDLIGSYLMKQMRQSTYGYLTKNHINAFMKKAIRNSRWVDDT